MKLEVKQLEKSEVIKGKREYYAVVESKFGATKIKIDKTRYNRARIGDKITVTYAELQDGSRV